MTELQEHLTFKKSSNANIKQMPVRLNIENPTEKIKPIVNCTQLGKINLHKRHKQLKQKLLKFSQDDFCNTNNLNHITLDTKTD